MKLSKLLAAVAALCFLVAPVVTAYAELSLKEGCKCASRRCCSAHDSECISRDSCSSRGCSCLTHGYASMPSIVEVYDPAYYYISKVGSRAHGRDSLSDGNSYPGRQGIGLEGSGPPDLDVVEYLPHSAQLVFRVLASDGPLTQKDLIAKTKLPPRTVRYALSRLKEERVIKECFYFPDARQSLYGVNTQIQILPTPATPC